MITILPKDNFKKSIARELYSNPDLTLANTIFKDRDLLFCKSGSKAISILLEKLSPRPDDEIFISTSTKNNYISSCVTCTIFNYCQPSKILTSRTKAIFLIHEYGIPHSETFEYLQLSKKLGVPLIEDCSQTFDSRFHDGTFVGTVGDYAIYSLPKLFSVSIGGILSSLHPANIKLTKEENITAKKVSDIFKYHSPYIANHSVRRKSIFEYIRKYFSPRKSYLKMEPSYITPYFFPIILSGFNYKTFYYPKVQLGASLNPNLLLLPVQPYNHYTPVLLKKIYEI